jgi:hypothetical protein
MLQPFAFGQLLHAVVFDRDCFPTVSPALSATGTMDLPTTSVMLTRSPHAQGYGDLIFGNSSVYLHPRPKGFPASVKWPGTYEVVDSLAQMARLHWP